MCLELIGDLLAEVEDAYISDIDERSSHLRSLLSPELAVLVDELEELHRDRARAMTRVALAAGIAMGRGLAEWGPGSPRGSA
ncbi:hypothetical protein D3C87_1136450 [compost metagenome]